MKPRQWVALCIITGAIWLIGIFVFGLVVHGLLFASGFFLSRAVCAEKINSLEEHNLRLKQRVDDMGGLLSSAADTIDKFNQGDIQVQVVIEESPDCD